LQLNLVAKKKHKQKHKENSNALSNAKLIPINFNKVNATKKAHEARSNATKKKIQSALISLKLEGKVATIANVATTAGIGYNTSKKYTEVFAYELKNY